MLFNARWCGLIAAIVAITATTVSAEQVGSYPVSRVSFEQFGLGATPFCAAPTGCCGTPAHCVKSNCCAAPPRCCAPATQPPTCCAPPMAPPNCCSAPVSCASQGTCAQRPNFYIAPKYRNVEYGESRPLLDLLGQIVSAPKKLTMWDRRIDNHNVSPRTVNQVSQYLQNRNIQGVKIRVNQYAPADEWMRLVANKQMPPFAKYTLGTVRHARYCLLPGRLFGGDEYNPYTNTLSLYSDIPAIGITESAFAADVQNRRFPGAFSLAAGLPIVSFLHETKTTTETLNYLSTHGDPTEVAATRRLLYARCGNQVFGELGRLAPNGSMMLQLGTVGVAHVAASRENARSQY